MARMLRCEVVFSGRVQGVGFRATARAIASKHPVSGWVRNEPDGSVRLVAEGASRAIDAYLAELRAKMARHITHEDRIDSSPVGEQGFDIRR